MQAEARLAQQWDLCSAPPAAPSCRLLSDRAEVRGAPRFMAFLPAFREAFHIYSFIHFTFIPVNK